MPHTRREFLSRAGTVAGSVLLSGLMPRCSAFDSVRVNGHLWIYASKFPPDWDSTPVLEQVFRDFKYAGIEGVEVMEVNLRRSDGVSRLGALADQYEIPVTGTSYYADMWDRSQTTKILEDVELVVGRLASLGGRNFGITVGDAGRKKTADELDAQAGALSGILKICDRHDVVPNLHNHTFEVQDDLYDLKGTLARVPELKLGPDLNWLIRGGVDPIAFIRTYGKNFVYLHIRDQTADGTWTEYVGAGSTDFPAIARELKAVNFGGEVAIELAADVPPVNPMNENWKKSREYVREIFGW